MRKKYKMTGFSRLLIFMIFFAPAAYLGASYYNGEDGIEKVKSLLNLNETANDKIEKKEAEIIKLEKRIEELKHEINQLK